MPRVCSTRVYHFSDKHTHECGDCRKRFSIKVGTIFEDSKIGALQRGSMAFAAVIERADTATLDGFAHAVVPLSATLVSTDEHAGYRHLGRTFNHGVVRHGAGEYVNGNIHSNGIESFWSQLKRQIVGTHHFVSPKHLNRYVSNQRGASTFASRAKESVSTSFWRKRPVGSHTRH